MEMEMEMKMEVGLLGDSVGELQGMPGPMPVLVPVDPLPTQRSDGDVVNYSIVEVKRVTQMQKLVGESSSIHTSQFFVHY